MYPQFSKERNNGNERQVHYLTFSWARFALFVVMLAVRAKKLLSELLSTLSAILDSTFLPLTLIQRMRGVCERRKHGGLFRWRGG